jgi:hypothetical protein
MRSLVQLLRQESPISLAREAVWRTRKIWIKKNILAQADRKSNVVTFRNIPYYRSDPAAFSDATRALITAFADEVCAGRYPFLGYGTMDLGLRPHWNLDFVSGRDWPKEPLANRSCVRFDGSDVKVPYELSRLQFLPILGKAHVLTSENRYREVAKDLLSFWMQENPFGVGVNWSLAMEVALRGISICFLLNLLSPFRPAEESWLAAVTHSLWQHLVYVEAHIEFSHLISSNHYLGNILGLYCLSSFLESPDMAKKRQLYRRQIEAESLRQVYEDGGDYESSTGYHVLVTQMFTSALLVMRATNMTPRASFVEKMRGMFRLLNSLASPSGQLPQVGDCDDGRIEILLDDIQQMLRLPVHERNSLCVSNLLGLGKCLLGEGCGATEDAKWFGFTENESKSNISGDVPPERVAVFPQSGIAVAKAGVAEIFFFALPNGIGGKGSHTHNDKLSVVLRLDGEEVLCDSGTGTYTRDIARRNRFRATAAHNTVVVDKQEQNTIEFASSSLFQLTNEAAVSPIEHKYQGSTIFVQASHSGYSSIGVIHTRTIQLHEENDLAIIEDYLAGSGRHLVELNFQIARQWRVSQIEQADSQVRCVIEGPRKLEVVVSAPGGVRAERSESLISMTYGSTTSASRIRLECDLELPASVTTQLRWAT